MEFVLLALEQRKEAVDSRKAPCAIENEGLLIESQVEPRHVHRNAVLLRGTLQLSEVGAVFRTVPWVDRAFIQGLRFVRNDEIEVEVDSVAEALAARTGSVGIIEGKKARLGLAISAVAIHTLKGGGKPEPAAVCARFRIPRNDFVDDLLCFTITDLCRIDDARAVLERDGDSIHENIDGLREFNLQQRLRRGEFVDDSILIEAIEAALAQIGEAVLQSVTERRAGSLARRLFCGFLRTRGLFRAGLGSGLSRDGRPGLGNNRKERVEARAVPERQHRLGDFVDCIPLHNAIADDAVHCSAAGVEQSHVVIDFCRRGDGRAGVAGGVFLFDGDSRGQSVDQIDIRFLDALKKLPRVSRQGLDVAPLALRVDGVEGQRRLSRAGDAGDHRQLAVRYLAIDVL
jgi:hypothetical protein